MFERVGSSGEAEFGEPRRDQAGMRRPAGMERFRHRTEIGHDAAGLRCRERDRRGRALGVEPAQIGAGRAGADRAKDAGRVPALAVMVAGVAARQLGPALVAGDIGGEHLAPAEAQRLGFGEDRWHQHGRDMAAAADIVVVERVAGGAVDPGRFRRGGGLAGEIEARSPGRRLQPLAQQLRRRVVGTGDHRRDCVDKAGTGDLDRLRRQLLERQIRGKPAEFLRQCHGDPPGCCGDYAAIRRGPPWPRLVTGARLHDEGP